MKDEGSGKAEGKGTCRVQEGAGKAGQLLVDSDQL